MTEGAKRCTWNENVVSSTSTGANLGNQSSYEALEDPRVEIAATDYNWHRENDAVYSKKNKLTLGAAKLMIKKCIFGSAPYRPLFTVLDVFVATLKTHSRVRDNF